jgi:predicted porin
MRDSSGFADNNTGAAPNFGGDNGDHTQELRHAYVWGIAGFYNNGPIQAGIGYEHNTKVRGPTLDDYDLTVTGGYNFGVVRPALVYERLDYDTPSGSLKRDLWGISLTAPLGPGAAYFFFGDALNGKGSAADGTRVGGLTKGSDTASKQWELSYTYPLSKRTQVYAGYVKLQNEKFAAYTFNINAYTINTTCVTSSNCPNGPNGKPGGLVLGMIHLF